MAGQTGAAMVQHTIRVTLRGKDNATYSGTLLVKNWTAVAPPKEPVAEEPRDHQTDPTGASYYVIAVVLVYGFSIVMLIASHIKRKHAKQVEDRQIMKYLQEFQIVKEKSSRDSYRHLKKSIVAKLHKERRPTYRTLSTTILPMMAIGLPTIQEQNDQLTNGNFLQVPGDSRVRSGSISTMYDHRPSRSSTPTLADNWRPRSASVSNHSDLRRGSVDRIYPYRTHHHSGDCDDIEIQVPVLMQHNRGSTGGSWRVLEDSIPELSESHMGEVSPGQQASPTKTPRAPSPHRANSPPQELRPDRLEAVLADRLLNNKPHRVQTHRPPPSPPGRVRRVGVAPLARVYVATSPRAQAHMRPASPRQPLYQNSNPLEDFPKHNCGEVPSGNTSLAPPGRKSPVPGPCHNETHIRDRVASTGTSERSDSPAPSDSSNEEQEENVWLLMDHETNATTRSSDWPQYPSGLGSRGSVSPLIKNSGEETPLNSREGSHSRETTPSRLSTRSSSLPRDSRGRSPSRSGHSKIPSHQKLLPRPSRLHPREPSPVTPESPETEQLLQVTVL